MTAVIELEELSKTYWVAEREAGLLAAAKSRVNRRRSRQLTALASPWHRAKSSVFWGQMGRVRPPR